MAAWNFVCESSAPRDRLEVHLDTGICRFELFDNPADERCSIGVTARLPERDGHFLGCARQRDQLTA